MQIKSELQERISKNSSASKFVSSITNEVCTTIITFKIIVIDNMASNCPEIWNLIEKVRERKEHDFVFQ